MPYFATFMAFWATLFLEFWKRKESTHAMMWGTSGFEAEEQDRPQFEGVITPSPITGKPHLYFSRGEKAKRASYSMVVILAFIAAVIAVVGSIFYLKLVLSRIKSLAYAGTHLGGIIAALANAIQIQVMNLIYGGVAIRLTDFENHRTDTAYEDSLIGKTFVFMFVNSFAALFYIAFVKPFITVDPCLGPCMSELQTNLGTIFLSRLALGSTLKVVIPSLMNYLNEQAQMKGDTIHPLTEAEKDYNLMEYHVMLGPFADYTEASIQYGYATMFVAAYPLAAIMSFVNNYIELRVDAWKLLQQCRRPEPRSAEDIGTWQTILHTVSIFALLINSGLIAFTGDFARDYTWTTRAWIFFTTAAGIY
ncbi:Ano6, partial [Symbiodinium microadriaticum]